MKWLALNDFHLGHNHIPPDLAHENLKLIVYPLLKDIDLLTIGGDFYDTSLYLDHQASIHAIEILDELCQQAKQHNFAIRVIRGTYTHDRDQLIQMVGISKKYQIDFAYYTDISIDICKGYSFLYLPDNLPYPIEEEMKRIKNSLTDLSDTGTVDCVVGHGLFDYTLPSISSLGQHVKYYSTEAFGTLVNQVVIMGHVHQHSNNDKVWYSGSFDRYCHGEEELKGCLLITLGDHEPKVNFIENTFSMPHISLTITGSTIEECYSHVLKQIKKKFNKPYHGYLRIIGREFRIPICAMLREKYQGQLVITDLDLNLKNKSSTKHRLDLGFKTYSSDIPTRDNLGALLHDYLKNNVMGFELTSTEINDGLVGLAAGGN